jgi:5-methylthioadenosine/S-adenosylhomocysteine deaminase
MAGPRRRPSRFDRAYRAGVVAEILPPAVAPTAAAREVAVRAAAEAIALQGCVLTPSGPVEDGYVVVGAGHQIQAVQVQQPQGVRVHPTGGVILPGLIDLHGHPEFNVFAAWEPPQLFANRYLWRGSPIYQALVRDTQDRLLAAGLDDAELRYAEIRALVPAAASTGMLPIRSTPHQQPRNTLTDKASQLEEIVGMRQ